MIFTRLKIDNIYSFKNAELDLSFKRKPAHSTVTHEYLPDRENFYFKKVCILSGSNSSGKTSVGRILCDIQNYLVKNMWLNLGKGINNKNENGLIEVDYVTDFEKPIAHRLSIEITKDNVIKKYLYANTYIGLKDSCFKTRKKLDGIIKNKKASSRASFIEFDSSSVKNVAFDFIKDNGKFICWYYLFSENDGGNSNIKEDINILVMKNILKAFDMSVDKVLTTKAKDEDTQEEDHTGYKIYFNNSDSVEIDINGNITSNKERLSKGTYDAVKLASFVSRVTSDSSSVLKFYGSCTYFLDEQMAYAHSEIEVAILNLIIKKAPINSQFFYTTHNYEVLDLNLPIHAFTFLQKTNGITTFIEAQNSYKKNDRNLINHIKNNYFKTLPSTSFLDELLGD